MSAILRTHLLGTEFKITQNKRLEITSGDLKGSVALVSKKVFDTLPKDNLWNKILRFLGKGSWVVLKIKDNDKETFVKVNANSLKKFTKTEDKAFKEALKNSAKMLDLTLLLKLKQLEKANSKEVVKEEKKEEVKAPQESPAPIQQPEQPKKEKKSGCAVM